MVEFILFILIICLGGYAYGTKQALFRVANETDRANYIFTDEINKLNGKIDKLNKRSRSKV